MSNPLVSVVIPCYNASKYIDEAILSIRNQTYKELEIILIDDCSTDNTFDLLQKHALEDKRILLSRNEANIRLIQTLNRGVSLASGTYLARMDADDISLPTRIQLQVQYLQENPNIDLVSSFTQYITHQGKFHSTNTHFCCTNHYALKFMALFESSFLHAALVGKTGIFKKYPFMDSPEIAHIEDYELWTRMFSNGIQFHTIPQYLYLYRRNPSSVSFKYQKLQWENHILNSRNFICTELGIIVDKRLHLLILTRSPEYTISLRKFVFPYFDKLQARYLHKYKMELNSNDTLEIHLWVQQRKLRIIAHYWLKAPMAKKFDAMVSLLVLLPNLSIRRTFKNLKGRLRWLLSLVING